MTAPYELPPQQLDAVSALDGPQRYQHCIARIADTQVVYCLRTEEGWVSACDEAGAECMPLWPHPAYALACATGEWAGATPAEIDVYDFVDDWLPAMASQGIKVIVFPTTATNGMLVGPAQVGADLEEEFSRY